MNPFSRKTLVIFIASAAILFALSILLHAYDTSPVSTGGGQSGSRYGANSYSVSAVGHAGLYDMLRRLDIPVVRGTGNTLATVGTNGVLVAAEPDLAHFDDEDGVKLLRAQRVLLVLPKWRAIQDAGRPAWISEKWPASLQSARQTLALLDGRGDVLRTEWPAEWTVNSIGAAPTGDGVVQLVRSANLRSLVGTDEGMLLGEMRIRGRSVFVLADPDVMANSGIVKGDNAAFMVQVVETLRKSGHDANGPVVFDETLHGFAQAEGSLVQLAFRFPFVLVIALLAAGAGVLLLAASGRFGAPRPVKPPLDFGKAGLLDNSARLLDYSGHHAVVLKNFIRMTVLSAAGSLHAPSGKTEEELAAWLDRIGKARGVTLSCAEILHTTATIKTSNDRSIARLFQYAGDIYRWKGEILHGYEPRRRHR